ncbi:hypothetical protein LIER_24130 [Lithospermum erythrorhizon]|uniref:Gag-pol polyprotein n=1 Tax=Lithospermum erythrorhizon TaxID=34254 RepID=A0AAV3R1I3_LITER
MDGGMTMRRKDMVDYMKMPGLFVETCFLSKIKPKDVKAVLQDENWINVMQEELVQFERNEAKNVEDRKSTLGGCFFLENNLVSWFSRKQNSISLSMVEADYIAAGSGCTQVYARGVRCQ